MEAYDNEVPFLSMSNNVYKVINDGVESFDAVEKLEELEKRETKHAYKVNFTVAAHISRIFLRLTTKEDSIDVMEILKSELIPIRDERQYPRLKTAHFRKPRYFIYRAA